MTVASAATVAGAVYKPDESIEPAPAGEIDQVTALLTVPLTVAASCVGSPPLRITDAGFTVTATEDALPLRLMVWVDGAALSMIVAVALYEPAITGLK